MQLSDKDTIWISDQFSDVIAILVDALTIPDDSFKNDVVRSNHKYYEALLQTVELEKPMSDVWTMFKKDYATVFIIYCVS